MFDVQTPMFDVQSAILKKMFAGVGNKQYICKKVKYVEYSSFLRPDYVEN